MASPSGVGEAVHIERAPSRPRGQSLVEFALILPLLLTLLGVGADMARIYQSWITLEAATRDAAEYAAMYAATAPDATLQAQRVICEETQHLAGFVSPGAPAACTSPSVTVTSYSLSTTAPGASATYPIATVTVTATLPFRTAFAYPLFTSDGLWTLSSTRSYAIVQGR